MSQTVLLGDPALFQIRRGLNPHTRDAWGRLKRVDSIRARLQWEGLKSVLERHGIRVQVVPPAEECPGMVFAANAGFRFGDRFYLSNLHAGRAGEREHYRSRIGRTGLKVSDLPSELPFEGEADFFPVGDPSGDPKKRVYLFTFGRIERPRWVPRLGFPPYRRIYGFRSDKSLLPTLQEIVRPLEVIPLELVKEAHYHGDTVLCPFGQNREHLLVYAPGLSHDSCQRLRYRFGERILPVGEADSEAFAANSFQVQVEREGRSVPVLLMPDGLTIGLYQKVRARGVIPFPVDVSEFLGKGGGAVKCMLLDLGEL